MKRFLGLVVSLILPALTCLVLGARANDQTEPEAVPVIRLRAVLPAEEKSGVPLIRLSADGQLVATGTGRGPVRIWQASSGKLIAALAGTEGQSPRAFSPTNDRLLASASLSSFSLYDLSAMRLRTQLNLKKQFGELNLFGSFSPNGTELLLYSEGKVNLWEVENSRLIASLPCQGGLFQSRFSSDSKLVLTSCYGKAVSLWDARTGQAISTFSHSTDVAITALSPDQRTLATTTLDGQVALWDVSTGQLKRDWNGHTDLITDALFSPDGRMLTTVGRDGVAKIWNAEKAEPNRTLRIGSNGGHLVFSDDSRSLVIVGSGRELQVWDLTTLNPMFTIKGHEKRIQNVEFSRDNRLLVSASEDAVNVWDVSARVLVGKLSDAVFPAMFSANSRTLATGGPKGSVMLWDVAER